MALNIHHLIHLQALGHLMGNKNYRRLDFQAVDGLDMLANPLKLAKSRNGNLLTSSADRFGIKYL